MSKLAAARLLAVLVIALFIGSLVCSPDIGWWAYTKTDKIGKGLLSVVTGGSSAFLFMTAGALGNTWMIIPAIAAAL